MFPIHTYSAVCCKSLYVLLILIHCNCLGLKEGVVTIGDAGKLLTCQYQSSIFQALSSCPLLPFGQRVAVTLSASLQHSHSTFITHGARACTPPHTYTRRGKTCHKSSLSCIDPAFVRCQHCTCISWFV